MSVQTGLGRLLQSPALQGKAGGRIGYLCHSASVTAACKDGVLAMHQVFGARLAAIFSPQHGLFADAQDNMIETPHSRHPHLGLPVYSLYAEARTPSPQMLQDIDLLVVDLQDIGARPYTFSVTMLLAMEACGQAGIPVWVLDRPNPLGGTRVRGNVLLPRFRSFIGLYPLPMQHGLTMGELALLGIRHLGVQCDLEVVAMEGWGRNMAWRDCRLPWVNPSPNIPSLETAHVFPGQVLWEGTNFSEGRGTTRPFELFGHPGFDPFRHLDSLQERLKAGGAEDCRLRPVFFEPTFEKWQGQSCGGYQLHITGPRFNPWLTSLLALQGVYQESGCLEWRQPPFEYEEKLLPIDILNGDDAVRRWVEEDEAADTLLSIAQAPEFERYLEQRGSVLMYA